MEAPSSPPLPSTSTLSPRSPTINPFGDVEQYLNMDLVASTTSDSEGGSTSDPLLGADSNGFGMGMGPEAFFGDSLKSGDAGIAGLGQGNGYNSENLNLAELFKFYLGNEFYNTKLEPGSSLSLQSSNLSFSLPTTTSTATATDANISEALQSLLSSSSSTSSAPTVSVSPQSLAAPPSAFSPIAFSPPSEEDDGSRSGSPAAVDTNTLGLSTTSNSGALRSKDPNAPSSTVAAAASGATGKGKGKGKAKKDSTPVAPSRARSVSVTPDIPVDPELLRVDEEAMDEDEDEEMADGYEDEDSKSAPSSGKAPSSRRRSGSSTVTTTTSQMSTSAKLAALTMGQASQTASSIEGDLDVGGGGGGGGAGGKIVLPPVPEWEDRPPPEEYEKLSSKEKRQLRNKLSARNFRHRRKEYITTLEEQISSRDHVISTLRDEMTNLKLENNDLKKEVTLLKEQWQSVIEKVNAATLASSTTTSSSDSSNVVTPTEEVASPVLSPSTPKRLLRQSSGITKPNLQKDISRDNKRTHWGSGGVGSGYVGVHTTLVPEVRLDQLGLNGKPRRTFDPDSFPVLSSLTNQQQQQQQSFNSIQAQPDKNMNPALNNLSPWQQAQLSIFTSHLRTQKTATGTFDDFFMSNPYTLTPKNIEEYRAQLYAKLANNVAGGLVAQAREQQQGREGRRPSTSGANGGNGNGSERDAMGAGFRPAFLTSQKSSSSSSSSSSLAGILSGKEQRDTYLPSPSFSFLPSNTYEQQQKDNHCAARVLSLLSNGGSALSDGGLPSAADIARGAWVASLARSTLFNKLGTALLDAFAGSEPGLEAPSIRDRERERDIDGGKVVDVLSGKSSLRVVPNDGVGWKGRKSEATQTETGGAGAGIDDLTERMGRVDLVGGRLAQANSSSSVVAGPSSPPGSPTSLRGCNPLAALVERLSLCGNAGTGTGAAACASAGGCGGKNVEAPKR